MFRILYFTPSVVDQQRVDPDPDPDPAFHFHPDPDPDPTPTLTHVEKSGINFLLLFTAVLVCMHCFYLSRQRRTVGVIIFNILYNIEIFL